MDGRKRPKAGTMPEVGIPIFRPVGVTAQQKKDPAVRAGSLAKE